MTSFRNIVWNLRKGLASLAMLYVLLIQLASTCPDIHGFLYGQLNETQRCEHHCPHHDEQSNEDEDYLCVVTLFAAGIAPIHESFSLHTPEFERHEYAVFISDSHQRCLISLPQARAPPRVV